MRETFVNSGPRVMGAHDTVVGGGGGGADMRAHGHVLNFSLTINMPGGFPSPTGFAPPGRDGDGAPRDRRNSGSRDMQ